MKKISFICLLLVVVLSALSACVFPSISYDGNKQGDGVLSKDEDSVLPSGEEKASSEGQSLLENQKKPSPESYKEEYKEAEKLAKSRDYISAIRILETILIDFPDADDVKDKIREYEDSHVQSILKNASTAFVTPSKDYGDALKIINSGLQYYPENKELKSKKDYYSQYVPVNLYDMKPFKGEIYKAPTAKDIYGNNYSKVFYAGSTYGPTAYYDLKGNYNRFTATVYGFENSSGATSVLKIMGDGVVLYENYSVAEDCRPFDIDLDITGVQELSIFMEKYGIMTGGIGMSDVMIQKTAK